MAIERFQGVNRFLSNFYEAPVVYEGYLYFSVENAFQAAKCANPELRKYFCQLSPGKAKELGYKVKLRPDWDNIKDGIMEELVRAKFYSNKRLSQWLLETQNEELIEGNSWKDTYWGVWDGKGQNKLGKILMKIREELRNK